MNTFEESLYTQMSESPVHDARKFNEIKIRWKQVQERTKDRRQRTQAQAQPQKQW